MTAPARTTHYGSVMATSRPRPLDPNYCDTREPQGKAFPTAPRSALCVWVSWAEPRAGKVVRPDRRRLSSVLGSVALEPTCDLQRCDPPQHHSHAGTRIIQSLSCCPEVGLRKFLQIVDTGVAGPASNQIAMGAIFNDAAVLENQYVIRADNCCEPMSNDNRGATLR